MKKRLLSLALGTMMVLSTLAGCGSKDGGSAAVNTKPEEPGKVLNIYCWNEEFKSRFEGYYKNVPSDVKVNWVITPNENNAYQYVFCTKIKYYFSKITNVNRLVIRVNM